MSIHRCCSSQAANKSWTKNASRSFTLTFDADVIASAAAKFGPGLGVSLSNEWLKIESPPDQKVASIDGRRRYLRSLIFTSYASQVLDLSRSVEEQLFGLS